MDDLFDDDCGSANYLENTQSMENLLSDNITVEPESPVRTMGNICLNRRFVEQPPEEGLTPEPTTASEDSSAQTIEEQQVPNAADITTLDSTPSSPNGHADKIPPEDDVLSTNSSLNSFASGSETNASSRKSSAPFINKYVKKVKSLMKK